MKRLQIFKPGTHTAASGQTLAFSESDLRSAAEAYDPAVHEAPIVVGHPKSDGPAYGWIKSLSFDENANALDAEPSDVDAQFAELVQKRRFSKISASFYTPDSPSNPKPGSYYLRHVGFLGAQPPALKGLRAVSFNEAEQGVVEFADWDDMRIAGMFRRLREWIISRFGIEEADKVLPGYEVDGAQISAAMPDLDDTSASPTFEEPAVTLTADQQKQQDALNAREAAIAAREAKLTTQSAEFAERDAALKAQEAATRRQGHAEFVAGLVKAGKLLPANEAGCVAFMASLDPAGVVEFGEGEAKTSKPGIEWFKTFIGSLPKAVEFKEVGVTGVDAVDFSDSDSILQAANKYIADEAKSGRTVNIAEAITHIKQQHSA